MWSLFFTWAWSLFFPSPHLHNKQLPINTWAQYYGVCVCECVFVWTCVYSPVPVISNHFWRCVSVMMIPTIWVTGSVSMTAKVKCGSSNVIGSAEGGGRAIHSMSSLAVDERDGLPWSVALICKKSHQFHQIMSSHANFTSEILYLI